MWEREKYSNASCSFLCIWNLRLRITNFFSLGGVQFCIPREPWVFFTWHGLFRGPQFGGGGNGAYSSTNLTFQEFVLPWDKNCKWQTVSVRGQASLGLYGDRSGLLSRPDLLGTDRIGAVE